MSQLVQLRQKIRSIQTTKKITHAVRLVSMSMYNKLEKIDFPLKNYTGTIKNLFIDALLCKEDWKSSLLFPSDVLDSKPLYVFIGTSKGLCGSLNSNLIRYFETSQFIETHQKPHFIAVGQKAINYLKNKNGADLVCSYPDLNSNNFIALADDLINKMVHGSHQYSSVVFYASQAQSFFTQKPHKFTLIPMSKEPCSIATSLEPSSQSFVLPKEFIWEQEDGDILNFLCERYLRSSVIHILFQALRAEHAARFLAMENSTNNAEKYLERLTLHCNKLRQAMITREVSELSASFPSR